MGDQKAKGIADIVFLLDATGSMAPCIEALKNNIAMFIDSLTTVNANNECPIKHWRAKVVGFRDFNEDPEPYIDNPFVEDPASLKNQLAALEATGGGDEPESLLDALYKVATMGQSEKGVTPYDPCRWRYRSEATRVVVVFTDASFHETMKEPAGGSFSDLANQVMQEKIWLNIFAPDMPCYNTLASIDKSDYNAIPYDTSDPQGAQKALASDTSDQTKFKKTLETLAKSITETAQVEVI